jgi:hypothetical protein
MLAIHDKLVNFAEKVSEKLLSLHLSKYFFEQNIGNFKAHVENLQSEV